MNSTELQDQEVKKAKIWQYIAMSLFVFVLLTTAVVLFWLLQPSQALTVKNDPTPIRPPEVSATDGIVFLSVDYCKNIAATGTSLVFMVGENHGAKIDIAWPKDTTPKGCQKIDVPVAIPGQTPTDVYHIVFEETYTVNPLKTSVTTFRSRSFKVTNDKLQPGDAKPTL